MGPGGKHSSPRLQLLPLHSMLSGGLDSGRVTRMLKQKKALIKDLLVALAFRCRLSSPWSMCSGEPWDLKRLGCFDAMMPVCWQVEDAVNFKFLSEYLAYFGLNIPTSIKTQASRASFPAALAPLLPGCLGGDCT